MEHRSLVMQQSARVDPTHHGGAGIVMFAVTGLVAQAPHDDAGMIAIPLDHAAHSLQPRRSVSRVVAEAGVEAVTLDVRFVDHVQPVLVAQVVEAVVVGIVRGAHGVDVGALHREDVLAHVVDGDGLSPLGMMIVAIDAHHRDRTSVHAHQTIDDPDPTKADHPTDRFHHHVIGIDQLAHHAIPLRILGRPRSHLRVHDLDARHVPGEGVGLHVIVGHVRDDGTANGATVETAQRGAHAPSLRERRGAGGIQHADPHVQGQRRASGLVIPVGVSVHTFDVHDGPRLEEHLAMQAGHPPLILILDVRLRAVTDHHDGDGVGAGVQMIGDVVFARESTVRSVPDERTVDEDRVHALGAADVQHGASPLPRSRNRDGASVHASGVLLGHRRRTQGPRHLHVGVVRQVTHVLQRPVARHAQAHPTTR